MEANVSSTSRFPWSATVEFDDDRGAVTLAAMPVALLDLALADLDEALGGLPADHASAAAVAALLLVHGGYPGAAFRRVTCSDGARSFTWSLPTPATLGVFARQVAPPLDTAALGAAARAWWFVAFATVAAGAVECFTEADAAATAVRGGLRSPRRVAGVLPPGPRAVALAVLAPPPILEGPAPGSVATLPVAVLAALCPSPEPALAVQMLAGLLDAATVDRVTGWVAQRHVGGPG